MAEPSVLAVFAHPDDESLSAGGLLARASAAGARTAVVTATWAEDSVRAPELAEALRILGAGDPRLLGYADALVPESAPGSPRLLDAPLDDVVRRLVAHIREFRPDIVVTHDAYGGMTGHADHLLTYRATVLAAQAAGLEQLYPDAGAPWEPSALYLATHPDSVVPALRELIGARRAVYSVPDEQITERLDVTPWLEAKIAAILAHRSEVARGAVPGLVAALPPETRGSMLATEWFIRCTPGPAATAEIVR
ncbi:PIG-L deacetylase family protein [Blastococcus goldschmidtiae]|uniref:PIG-L deacetylase family protein n=1 Tax=Blastococcus goldschmidtiae TaxID=3075546 RepID=A0ABU2K5E6_9ACTN|nr:PIG-L deacetylase family protein [Blastococcus sp. DSM 46792]MDT0275412.1 PIG-L deacetylase family protein [Blastococcus sp. DSM 46792]